MRNNEIVEIANTLRYAYTMVCDVITKYEKDNIAVPLHRPDRPPVLDDCDIRQLTHMRKKDRSATLQKG